jgi:hypothetical protein
LTGTTPIRVTGSGYQRESTDEPGLCVNGRRGDRAGQALRKRFETEERQAIEALARWIGHPALRSVIERRRLGAETVVMPIAHLLATQSEVIRFCWHVYEITGIEPGWVLRRGKPWLLTVSQLNVIERVKADFRGVVQLAVNELEGAGVALIPSWNGDHVVVGELLLLAPDWEKPPLELAEDLQPPAIGAIRFDASGTIHRRGSGERASNNIGALRRALERHKYGEPPRAPYAGGGTRALPQPTRQRREALAKVLERFPDATASRIATTFDNEVVSRDGLPATAGGYLRQLLEHDDGGIVHCPSKSTLHEDFKALTSERDGKQSG